MKILVTGGLGFIGSRVVLQLLKRDISVIVADLDINKNKDRLENDIKKIAYLARIKISQSESILLEKKLAGIMDLIDKMQKVDTESIEPMSHALDINQPLRKDEVSESYIRKETMPLAPEAEDSLFMVPQVIE